MHFSSPSGQRLSWCRPWKRGAVGFFSNGYSSVTTFLNMVRNVTPKPAIGSQSCSRRLAPPEVLDGSATERLLAGHGWDRVATGRLVDLVRRLVVVLGLRHEAEPDEDHDR